MAKHYSYVDAPKRAQTVAIEWERLELPDDCQDRPDERQDGFWPSQDPKDAGYVGKVPKKRFEQAREAAARRMREWESGEWQYIGVIARAHITIPIGGNSFRDLTIDSAGLWGIESDAGDYLDDVFEQEKAALMGELKTLAAWVLKQ